MRVKKILLSLTVLCILLALVGCSEPKCANNSYKGCLNDADPECVEGLCDECCKEYKEDEWIKIFDIPYECNIDH